MKNKKRRGDVRRLATIASFGASLIAATAVLAAAPDIRRADELIRSGRAAEAYALLSPHEDRLAGDIRFDYLLGIAALDSGKADKATLAFERVLAMDPDFAGARLDMARGYYHLGDLARARAELDAVLAQNPPPAARNTVTRYLQLIEQQERAKKTPMAAYAEIAYGRDSNVNNSTAQSRITVPAFGDLVFTIDPTNVKRGDNYALLGAGADIAHEVGDGYAVFAGGDLRYRANASEDRFDYKSVSGRTGIAWSDETNVVRATLSGDRYDLDHERNRTGTGLGADWRRTLDPATLVNVFGTYVRYRFDGTDLSVNDFDQYLLGIGGLRLFHEGRSAVNAAVFVGKEDDTRGRADGNKDIRGLRIGGQLQLHDRADLYLSVGAQRGTYDQQNIAFQKTRADNQYDVVAGVVWRLDQAWSLRPQVLFIHNESNLPIYAYKRTDLSVTLRRDFR